MIRSLVEKVLSRKGLSDEEARAIARELVKVDAFRDEVLKVVQSFLGRRGFLTALTAVTASYITTKVAKGDVIVGSDNILVGPRNDPYSYDTPFANAVVYKDGRKVIGKVWSEQRERYVRVLTDEDFGSVARRVVEIVHDRFGRGVIDVMPMEYEVYSDVVVNFRDVWFRGYGAKLVAKSANVSSVFSLATEGQIYRVRIEGFFIDCNKVAGAGIRSVKGVIDSVIRENTVINAKGGGIVGTFYGTLVEHNVCNFNGAGINIGSGQHITIFDNSTYMNEGPGLIAENSDTCYVIRHKSLSDNTSNTFWRSSVVLGGYKMKTFVESEVWFSNSNPACYYAIFVQPMGNKDEFTCVVNDVMVRNESGITRQQAVRVNLQSDNQVCRIGRLDIRGSSVFDVQHVNPVGKTIIDLPKNVYNIAGVKHIWRSVEGKVTVTGDGVTTDFKIVDDLDDKFPTTDLATSLSASKYGAVPVIEDIDGDGKVELVAHFLSAPASGETVTVSYRISCN